MKKIGTPINENESYLKREDLYKELLRKHSEGLIGLSACIEGEVPSIALSGNYEIAKRAALEYEEIFGKKPLGIRGGGSIPIINLFEETLGIKSILMGFGLESDAVHSPNENFPILNFLKGIETIAAFYHYYQES